MGPDMGPQTLEGSVVCLQHGLLRTSTATPSPASVDSKAASATCSHSTQTLGLRGSRQSPILLACDPINPLLAILIQTEPDSIHGREINTVSLEEYPDERERYIYRKTTTAKWPYLCQRIRLGDQLMNAAHLLVLRIVGEIPTCTEQSPWKALAKKCEELRKDNWRHSVAYSGMSTIPVPEVNSHRHTSNIPQQKAPLLSWGSKVYAMSSNVTCRGLGLWLAWKIYSKVSCIVSYLCSYFVWIMWIKSRSIWIRILQH